MGKLVFLSILALSLVSFSFAADEQRRADDRAWRRDKSASQLERKFRKDLRAIGTSAALTEAVQLLTDEAADIQRINGIEFYSHEMVPIEEPPEGPFNITFMGPNPILPIVQTNRKLVISNPEIISEIILLPIKENIQWFISLEKYHSLQLQISENAKIELTPYGSADRLRVFFHFEIKGLFFRLTAGAKELNFRLARYAFILKLISLGQRFGSFPEQAIDPEIFFGVRRVPLLLHLIPRKLHLTLNMTEISAFFWEESRRYPITKEIFDAVLREARAKEERISFTKIRDSLLAILQEDRTTRQGIVLSDPLDLDAINTHGPASNKSALGSFLIEACSSALEEPPPPIYDAPHLDPDDT